MAHGSGAGGPRSLDGWHAALELGAGWLARGFGAGSPRSLDVGWVARQELGSRGFGWLARGSGAGGPRSLDGWHAALDWGSGAGGTGSLDGWHAAQDDGARRWMGGTRLRSWGPADFGWLARGSGAGGMQMDGWRGFGAGSAEFGWVARSFGAGGPRSLVARGGARTLDGWPQELGAVARGPRFWMAGMQLWSWGARTVWMGGMEFGWVAGPQGPAEFGWVARGSGTGGSWGPAEFGWVARGFGAAPAVLMHVAGTFNIDGLSAGWVTACTHTC